MSMAERFESDQTFLRQGNRLEDLPSYDDGWPRCPGAINVGVINVDAVPFSSELLVEREGRRLAAEAPIADTQSGAGDIVAPRIEIEDLVGGPIGQLAVVAA